MCRGIPEHTERPEQRRSLERCRKPGILDSESSRAQRRAARFPLHSRRGLCRDFRTRLARLTNSPPNSARKRCTFKCSQRGRGRQQMRRFSVIAPLVGGQGVKLDLSSSCSVSRWFLCGPHVDGGSRWGLATGDPTGGRGGPGWRGTFLDVCRYVLGTNLSR